MKHAVIFAHPDPKSFTAAVADSYAAAVEALGGTVVRRDLYGIGFDPCLQADERPFAAGFQPQPDVAAERGMLQDCDVFMFAYPLWLNTPPAILKGYLERVFGFGFAYGAGGHSYNPLLLGRKMISFSSSGAPLLWLRRSGSFEAIQTLFDRYFADLCGLELLDHIHSGGIVPGAGADFIHARLRDVRDTVNTHFGRKA